MTKFKILEIIIKNRNLGFETIQKEIMKAFPEMYWEDIKEYLYQLKREKFVVLLEGDNDICSLMLQSGTRARLEEMQAAAKDEKLKLIFGTLAGLFKFSL